MNVPPHSPEDELGVLGSCLLDCALIPKIDLQPKDFYDRRHVQLWDSLQQQYNEGKAMDALTIGAWLKDKNLLDQVGGYALNQTPRDAVDVYADLSRRGELIRELGVVG